MKCAVLSNLAYSTVEGKSGVLDLGKVSETYVSVVTADHLTIGDLVAQAVGGLVGVHGHVQHIRRMHVSKVGSRSVELSSDEKKRQ